METVVLVHFIKRWTFYHDFQQLQRQFFFHRWAALFTKLKKSTCDPRVSLFNRCFNCKVRREFLFARSSRNSASCIQEIKEYASL